MLRSFRETLRHELDARKRRNSRFSLRAYARTLDLAAGQLSEILSGKKGLSRDKAATIADRLGLNAADRADFLESVDAECARAALQRELAHHRLKLRSELVAEQKPLAADVYSVVAEWYHFAILALTGTPAFDRDPEWIARQLSITPDLVRQGIARLLRMGLLEERAGRLVATDRMVYSPRGQRLEAVRRHHQQIFNQAIRAIERIPEGERDFEETTCAFRPEDLPEIQQKKREFMKALYQEYGTRTGRTRVYSLGSFFFPLSVDTAQTTPAAGKGRKRA